MAGFEDLVNPDYNQVIGADFEFVDADTVKKDGELYRLPGVAAPEVYKSFDPTQEVGGVTSTEQVISLANQLGFTQLVSTTGPDGEEKAAYGRWYGDLINPKTGESFSRSLAREGITEIDHRFDPGNVLLESREFAAALKTGEDYAETEWDQARQMIEQSVKEQQKLKKQFKQAQDFSGQIGYLDDQIKAAEEAGDTVTANILKQRRGQFNEFATASLKYTDRDQITGSSLNPFSTAWNTGWLGVGQSMYGVANLLGEKIGNAPLSEFGEAGVYGIEKEIADKGKILLDYKEVDGFWDGVEFITNNAAISIPYMAINDAPPVTGASAVAPAVIAI